MKRTATYVFLCVAVFAVLAASPGKSSSGAPASHTGAPNEKTCATSGCHDDHALNNGSAKLEISIDEDGKQIKPGKIYDLRLKIADANINRFGFQIVALRNNKNDNAGEFIIADKLRTKLLNNSKELLDRSYVTYTFDGTDAVENGVGEWTLKWKAPQELNEQITFYIAAVSANDDMSDKGDYVYTTHLTVNKK